MKLLHTLFLASVLFTSFAQAQESNIRYATEALQIQQLSANTYVHISYFSSETFGRVPCNGMVVVDNGEALVFDTPVSEADSYALIAWLEDSLHVVVRGLVVTHFHEDCVGGLEAFHAKKISSYATHRTIARLQSEGGKLPKIGFDEYLEIPVGSQKVQNAFLGEGHTPDNCVSYFPADKVLFGGCLIKEMGAGKGNLADANLAAWSATVEAVKTAFPEAEIIIPGHGKAGGRVLLEYTQQLFAQEK